MKNISKLADNGLKSLVVGSISEFGDFLKENGAMQPVSICILLCDVMNKIFEQLKKYIDLSIIFLFGKVAVNS